MTDTETGAILEIRRARHECNMDRGLCSAERITDGWSLTPYLDEFPLFQEHELARGT